MLSQTACYFILLLCLLKCIEDYDWGENVPNAMTKVLAFSQYLLFPVAIIFLFFYILLIATQISAFIKEMAPLPKWFWIFYSIVGLILGVLFKFTGNHAITNALVTGESAL